MECKCEIIGDPDGPMENTTMALCGLHEFYYRQQKHAQVEELLRQKEQHRKNWADLQSAASDVLAAYKRTGDHDHDGYAEPGDCVACKLAAELFRAKVSGRSDR